MAAKFPCPNPPTTCDTNASPATGYSAEADDSTTFIGLAWAGATPPLNKPFTLAPCEGIADSQVSQADADRLAQNAAVICANGCNGTVSNTAQTASAQCNDGSVYLFTVEAGQWVASTQVLADRLAFAAAVAALTGHSLCVGTLAPSNICKSAFYLGIISIISTDPVTDVSISNGTLPPGISMLFESDRVVFQGTPTAYGESDFTLAFTTSAGVRTSKSFTINVAGIVTEAGALPAGNFNGAYSTTITAFSIPGVNTVWSISAGALPGGLSINPSTGVISGTASSSGNFNFTVLATMDGALCTANYSIKINAIDWTTLVWSNISISGSGAGSYSGNATNSQTGALQGWSGAIGTLTYAGPTVTGQVTVTTAAGAADEMGFRVQQDGVDILFLNNTNIGTPGTRVFQFTIHATAGSTITIRGIGDTGAQPWLFLYAFGPASIPSNYSCVFSNP